MASSHIERRYDALRALAAGLAAAITIDEVSAAIEGNAADIVGASACGVIVMRHEVDGTHSVIRQTDEGLQELLAACPGLLDSVWPVVDDGAPALVDLDCGDHRDESVAGIYPVRLEPGLGAVMILTWRGRAAVEPDVAPVVGLCWAALVRAWASQRIRELGPTMDALLDQASIGLAFLDIDLRYRHVNGRLAEIHNRPVSEHLGRTLREINPEFADTVEPLLRWVIETGRATGKLEVSSSASGGDRTVVYEVAYLPVEVDGEVVGVGAVVDDVTADRLKLEDLQQKYEFERSVATRLQRGLTPRDLPQPDGFNVAARYAAGSAQLGIGGDWYDVIELGDGRVAFVIGDVVGHGIDAAIAMVRLRHVLAGLAHSGLGPIELLERLDEYATGESDQFVATLAYGRLDPGGGHVTLSSAGHLPPLLITGTSVEAIEVPGTPVGISVAERAVADLALEHGETLLLYTDGVIEQRGESVAVGLERLMDLARRPFSSAEELVERVAAEALGHNNSDDAAVMVLRRV